MQRIYADHNATSPILAEVRARLSAAWQAPFANPSSAHGPGRAAKSDVEQARQRVAALVAAEPHQVVFTASATEANASALYGHATRARAAGRTRLVVSAIEHPSVLEAIARLEELGQPVTRIAAGRGGEVLLDALADALPGAGVCALMWANNETGVVQPVAAVAALCLGHGVRLHIDAVQAAGKLGPLPRLPGIDTLSVSAHKIGGLGGSAALIIPGVAPEPWMPGGGQQDGRRGGTENVHGIAAFGWAADLWLAHGDDYRAGMRAARDAFEQGLAEDGEAFAVIGAKSPRLPNTSDVIARGVRAEALLAALDLDGLAASHGSACATGSLDPSPVLLAMGLSTREAKSALRLSFGPLADAAEGVEAARRVRLAAARLRQ